MRSIPLLVLSTAILISGGSAWAGTITDPAMGMDAGSFSTPLSLFTGFTPSQSTGGGILDLSNDTGELITSILFPIGIKAGLAQNLVDASFNCNGGSDPTLPNPFFLSCAISYNFKTGELDISFFGVNPLTADPATNDLVGDQEGIPPLKPGCTAANADTTPCEGQGHFLLTFNNNFSLRTTDVAGGWLATDTDLFDGPPVVSAPTETLESVPEPATFIPLAAAGLAAWFLRRRLLRA